MVCAAVAWTEADRAEGGQQDVVSVHRAQVDVVGQLYSCDRHHDRMNSARTVGIETAQMKRILSSSSDRHL